MCVCARACVRYDHRRCSESRSESESSWTRPGPAGPADAAPATGEWSNGEQSNGKSGRSEDGPRPPAVDSKTMHASSPPPAPLAALEAASKRP